MRMHGFAAATALTLFCGFAAPALASDPQLVVTTSIDAPTMHAKLLEAAHKVCAEAARQPDADEFGTPLECLLDAMRNAEFRPVGAPLLAASADHQP